MRWRIFDTLDWLCKVTGHRWCHRLAPVYLWARRSDSDAR